MWRFIHENEKKFKPQVCCVINLCIEHIILFFFFFWKYALAIFNKSLNLYKSIGVVVFLKENKTIFFILESIKEGFLRGNSEKKRRRGPHRCSPIKDASSRPIRVNHHPASKRSLYTTLTRSCVMQIPIDRVARISQMHFLTLLVLILK